MLIHSAPVCNKFEVV